MRKTFLVICTKAHMCVLYRLCIMRAAANCRLLVESGHCKQIKLFFTRFQTFYFDTLKTCFEDKLSTFPYDAIGLKGYVNMPAVVTVSV